MAGLLMECERADYGSMIDVLRRISFQEDLQSSRRKKSENIRLDFF
jgi:hypothetical protein